MYMLKKIKLPTLSQWTIKLVAVGFILRGFMSICRKCYSTQPFAEIFVTTVSDQTNRTYPI